MGRDWEGLKILCHYGKKATPIGRSAWLCLSRWEPGLQPVEDLIGPEPLKTGQRLVDTLEFLDRKADDLLDRM